MTAFKLDERVRLSVELALTARTEDVDLHRRQEDTARAIGMTGAEVDMARRGSSFDVKAATAVALAILANDDNLERARKAGLCERSRAEIVRLALALRSE